MIGELTDIAVCRQAESASDLSSPLQGKPSCTSALCNSPFSTRWFVITFGDDSRCKQVGAG